jgi:hypothetical protein
MAEIAFDTMFGAVVVYVVLGNYLYFAKVLPVLNEPPKLLPSGQMNDVDRYLDSLDERLENQWFVPILKNIRVITIVYLIGFSITVAMIFLD